jgi:hypothetical protein
VKPDSRRLPPQLGQPVRGILERQIDQNLHQDVLLSDRTAITA